MTIGIVLSNAPGYSETFFNSKIKGLQKRGFKVLLFTQKKQKGFSLCKVKNSLRLPQHSKIGFIIDFVRFLSICLSNFKIVKDFYYKEKIERESSFIALKSTYVNAHILKEKLDWLHFGFATMAIGKENIARCIGSKMSVSFRGFDINVYPLKHPECYNLLWEKVDKVHSISNFLLERAYKLGLKPIVRKKIITPCVNLPIISNNKDLIFKSIKIVTIARLNWIKGLDDAIQAMHILKQHNIDFEYHIIGGGSKIERERYKFHSYSLELQEKVIFHGKLSYEKSMQVLSQATIYLQPSINEGFCNAVLEAQSFGKLCVVTNVGGLPENIIDNETGWLVPEFDPKSLAKKIMEVIELPNTEKKQISENAKNRIKSKFTCIDQQEEFAEFYNN